MPALWRLFFDNRPAPGLVVAGQGVVRLDFPVSGFMAVFHTLSGIVGGVFFQLSVFSFSVVHWFKAMKKRLIASVVLTGLISLVSVGCSNKNIDTDKVRAAFPNIAGDAKAQLEQSLADIDATNFAAAVKPLEKATYEIKMDAGQRKILEDTLKKVRAKAAQQK
jgi:hypothetical protein